MKRKLALNTKMTIGGIVLLAVPLIIVGVIAYFRAAEAITKEAQSRSALTAKLLANSTQKILLEELEKAKGLAASHSAIAAAHKIATDGFEAAGKELAAIARTLEGLYNGSGKKYEAVDLIDASGLVIADSLGGEHVRRKINTKDRDYFKTAKEKGQANIGQAVISKASGKPVVVICAPIKSGTGSFEGAVLLVMPLDFISKMITETKLGKTGYGWMIDGKTRFIAHPNPDNLLNDDMAVANLKGMEEIGELMVAGKTGVTNYVYKGIPKICGYAPVPVAGWSLGATQDTDEFMGPIYSIRNIMALIMVISLVAAIIVIYFFSRTVANPIRKVAETLVGASDRVGSSSGEVAAAGQQLAEGASEQAASIEETSASLEEISSMTKSNAEHSNEADSLMKEASKAINTAGQDMVEMAASMARIAESGGEISKIVRSIDEIAFQTNLLALNAAVEAARAGEAGMGFAVVADEVRALALRSAEAARNTQSLVEDTVKRINEGAELVTTAQSGFDVVAKSSEKVASLVGEIAAASMEQSQGVDQVALATNEMDQVVQRNAANAEESAAAAEEMSGLAEIMHSMVNQLAILVNGDKGLSGGKGAQYTSKAPRSPKAHSAIPDRTQGGAQSDLTLSRGMAGNEFGPQDGDDLEDF
jgi:methyl-accepting chemotaxis protein